MRPPHCPAASCAENRRLGAFEELPWSWVVPWSEFHERIRRWRLSKYFVTGSEITWWNDVKLPLHVLCGHRNNRSAWAGYPKLDDSNPTTHQWYCIINLMGDIVVIVQAYDYYYYFISITIIIIISFAKSPAKIISVYFFLCRWRSKILSNVESQLRSCTSKAAFLDLQARLPCRGNRLTLTEWVVIKWLSFI